MLFAHVFRVGAVGQDLPPVVGLAIAMVLLGLLASWYVRSSTAKRPRPVATLSPIAVVTVIWTAVEAAVDCASRRVEPQDLEYAVRAGMFPAG